ncbi:MAG: cell division protein FtsZ [Candidatus Woesearchaeota archaeon]
MDFLVKNALENMNDGSSSELDQYEVGQARMIVVGCGGAGQNMIDWLYSKGVQGAEIVAVNTDLQDLKLKQADKKILVGKEVTRGLGAGGRPEKGAEAAQESAQEIKEAIQGADMVFVCAGMGGGTGTGVAPAVAKIAKDMGAIVIGVVTMPFNIERARIDKAEFGLKKLRSACDTVVVIDNNRLVKIAGQLPVKQAFAVANELISVMIKGIVEIISTPSLVNLDFADVKAIMSSGGVATVGIGASDTNRRVEEAVAEALENPLLDIDYKGATGALIHITGGEDMVLEEINRAGELITHHLHHDANVIWGARVDESHNKRITIMSITTGVNSPQILGHETKEQAIKAGEKNASDLGIKTI